ncbi:hypothetical protein CANCADRAFT_109342 [Tortispora caseinolytica NRRL Y-17796]|uniref:SNF5-domain-containing protein n=1 Tax=Tortispora caseinolytica NRRL Y-17796 TaxID=767744 RepID=A0A1E4TFX4_9ASCO|nr:hypothetical protein CANCADRAFT_109342 [Tortispora caseinolytica NRRL Y-17796]
MSSEFLNDDEENMLLGFAEPDSGFADDGLIAFDRSESVDFIQPAVEPEQEINPPEETEKGIPLNPTDKLQPVVEPGNETLQSSTDAPGKDSEMPNLTDTLNIPDSSKAKELSDQISDPEQASTLKSPEMPERNQPGTAESAEPFDPTQTTETTLTVKSTSSTPAFTSEGKSELPSKDSTIPANKEDELAFYRQLMISQYIERDQLHTVAFHENMCRNINFFEKKRENARILASKQSLRQDRPDEFYGPGYSGYGNGTTGIRPRLLFPDQRRRSGRKAREFILTKQANQKTTVAGETLVPVRIDLDCDNAEKIRDTFVWNLQDPSVPIDVFAENLLEDYGISLNYTGVVANQISSQIKDFHAHVFHDETMQYVEPKNDELPFCTFHDDDMRIVIKLDITVGNQNLVDQFEWDINNPVNSPEEFAKLMCRELALVAEFETAVAHSIREQCQLYTKSLFLAGYAFDGRPIEYEDIKRQMCSTLTQSTRHKTQVADFGPSLYELTDQEIEKINRDNDREARRKRRQGRINRRGGPALPDLRDIQRTARTRIVSTVLPGAIRKPVKRRDDSDSASEGGSPAPGGSITSVNPLAVHVNTTRTETKSRHTRQTSDKFTENRKKELVVKLKIPGLLRFLRSHPALYRKLEAHNM